jgi:hypothetical protein
VARAKKKQDRTTGNGANLGFEEKLWRVGDVVMEDVILILSW